VVVLGSKYPIQAGDFYNDDACTREITRGASDVSGRHIVSWILVETHQENSFVMTVRGKDDEIVEQLEVSKRRTGPAAVRAVPAAAH
jgi:hypothetical protein